MRQIWGRGAGDSFCLHASLPDEARGEGLIKAARGALGHWLEVRKGRILNYQIVAPATSNFHPATASESPALATKPLSAHQYKKVKRRPLRFSIL
jgi:hydrogenase large subunit